MRISDWSSDVCSPDLEGEVAGTIAAALQARLTAPEASAVAQVPTTNPQAYDDYLRGLNFMRLADKGDWTGNVPQAIAAVKRAIAADRSEERRVGKGGVRTCRYRWSPVSYNNNTAQF